MQADIIEIQVEVGNHYEMIPHGEYTMNKEGLPNNNRWTAFVRLKSLKDRQKYPLKKIIKYIDFTLHESFSGPNPVRVYGNSF